jgi:hypothetical protein
MNQNGIKSAQTQPKITNILVFVFSRPFYAGLGSDWAVLVKFEPISAAYAKKDY